MEWKYFVPAEWPDTTPRVDWQDIWVKPASENYEGQSLWLTVWAVPHGSGQAAAGRALTAEEQAELAANDILFVDRQADIFLNQSDFDLQEMLHAVQAFLQHMQLPCTSLVAADFDDFRGSNAMAETMDEITRQDEP